VKLHINPLPGSADFYPKKTSYLQSH